MLQPLLPLIEYNVNKEYIASILCENRDKPELACNGKCYLDKKVKDSHDDSHKHSVPKIDLSKYPISLIDKEGESKNINLKIYSKSEFYELVKETDSYASSILKPPIT